MGLFDAAFQAAIETATRTMEETAQESDYLNAEGLLMCGNCHTPRQMVLDVPMIGQRIVPVLCRCAQERREAEEAQRKAVEEQQRINAMRRMGITSANYREMTFAADDGNDPKTAGIARRYVEKRADMLRENIGLLLHGGVGGGKTFWAAAIANAMIDNGCSAMITTIPALISAMAQDFESDKTRILEQITRVRFLILDDVGFERQTSYAAEKMYEIINARYLSGRPLIVTTNLSLQEISNPENMEYKRVFDRIIEMCQPIHVSGEGRRKAISKAKAQTAREILGL